MEYAIETENLTKKFGDFFAVNNLDLRIKKGEIFGLLGPNGAGKTTTINILIGLSLPSSGTAKIAGLDVTKHSVEIKKSLGIAAQDAYFDHHLSLKDNLFYHGLLYGLPRKELKKRVDTALQWSKLEKYRTKKFQQLMNYFLGIPFGSVSLIVLLIIATAAFFSSLAVAISMALDNPYHLMVVTSLVVVPMSFFCGIFIPVTDLPNWAQPVIEAIPLTVAVQAARATALSTGSNPYLWQNMAYIIAFTIPVFLIGLHLFKKKVIT